MKKNILLLLFISLFLGVNSPVDAMKRKRQDDQDEERSPKKRKVEKRKIKKKKKKKRAKRRRRKRTAFERQYDMYWNEEAGLYFCPQCSSEDYAGVADVNNLISHFNFYGHGFGTGPAIEKGPSDGESSDEESFDEELENLSGFANLPPEVKNEIFRFLPLCFLLRNIGVCAKEYFTLVEEHIKKSMNNGELDLRITDEMLGDSFKNLQKLVTFLAKYAPHVRINLDMSRTRITDFHIGAFAVKGLRLKSLDVCGCRDVTLKALQYLQQAMKGVMIKSDFGNAVIGELKIEPAEPVQRRVQAQGVRAVWPPITTEIRTRDDETQLVLPERRTVVLRDEPRRFTRDIDFYFTIVPSLQQPWASADCAFYAMFAAACMAAQGNRDVMRLGGMFRNLLNEWRNFLTNRGEALEFLHSGPMELLIRNHGFFQYLRNNNRELRANVSIVDGLNHLENALRTARRNEYEIRSSLLAMETQDIRRLRADEGPKALRPVGENGTGQHNSWRYVPAIYQNIVNFRNTGAEQIIILNTGQGHWVALRLFRQDGQDHIEIADSAYHGSADLEEIARRVYQIFVTDPLPPQ